MNKKRQLLLTIDWEDWFHLCDIEPYSLVKAWPTFGFRIEQNTRRTLALLRKHQAHATFFVIGALADLFPHLIHEIAADGHELAWHGTTHHTWSGLSDEQLMAEWFEGLNQFRQKFNCNVQGFRAPMWSLTEPLLRQFNQRIKEEGLSYDSSLVPLAVVGNPEYPRTPTRIADLIELPPTIVSFFGIAAPVSMSWGFRWLPAWYVKWMNSRFARKNDYLMLAIHPWELDPEQPKLPVGGGLYFTHYAGLRNTERRLDWFLTRFKAVGCAAWLEQQAEKGAHFPEFALRSPKQGKE